MSGGFFRGTSADQDTRFSNKQAKLLKSQKFAPELDHLVDTSRVKMDVIRPWIANRVTELLGFEDEVLINFIYGLLDGKNVNGKQVQISLTGFMEKNTGKFMKELWTLLLSAEKNASGVPQQFLDAKEEETMQKKAEADRIANEIQKKKEKEAKELEQERKRKMDGVVDISKASNAVLEPISKHMVQRASSTGPKDEKEMDERNGSRGKNRVSKSPHSADHYPSSPRGTRSGSIGKSFSNSRSYSDERHKSRSVSGSPEPRGRSISSERAYRSPRRRSMTPRRRLSPRGSLSPSRRRPSHSRRRFRSRSPRRSPSPGRRRLRSPFRHRSPSPVRRRSPSPVRRRLPSPVRRRSRSPVRRRSPSPMRRRSPAPVRRRSPSPMRRRSPSPLRRRSPSPVRRRSPSPVRRRSPPPLRRRSPSPLRRRRRRSPSTPRRRSPSPMRRRSPISIRRRSPTPSRRRSPSPYGSRSPSPVQRRSPSPVRRKSPKHQRGSPVRSSRERIRTHEKLSPVRHVPLKERVEHPVETRKGPDSVARRAPNTLRSPQRDPKDRNDLRNRVPSWSPSPERSPVLSESPPGARKRSASEDRRSSSPYESPVRQPRERTTRDGRQSPQKPREHKPRRDSPETSGVGEETYYTREDRDHKPKSLQKGTTHSSNVGKHKDSPMNDFSKEEYSPERSAGGRATETRSHLDNTDLRKKNQEIKSEKTSGRVVHPEVPDRRKSPPSYKHTMLGEKQQVSYSIDSNKADEKNRSHSNNNKDSDRRYKSETVPKSVEKLDQNNRVGSFDSGSKDGDKNRADVKEKRKHKRSNRHEMASDDDDSQIDERKEVKRRRKEEKKLRKEEKRRRREERRRRREERRAEKLKGRSMDTGTPPSDSEKNQSDAYASDGEHVARRESRLSDTDEKESEQKKLEIELRTKALESLRAKKGIGH